MAELFKCGVRGCGVNDMGTHTRTTCWPGDVAKQPSSEIRGFTPGNPSWALAWILSAKGECQPAGLFRCHRRVCVCLAACTTHTLTNYVLRMNVSYQEDF